MNLVERINLPLALIMSMALTSSSCHAATDSSTITTTYNNSSENFPNPERGFFVPFNPINNSVSPLKLSDLQRVRSNNMSLVRRIYLINRSSPLSQSFLDMVAKDCETARQAGVKLILKFTYNWQGGGPDAPRDRILSHLDQLEPIFKANYDVIAYVHAGFIGYWGEWNRSSNNLLNTRDMKTIVSKILSVLPTQRMVALRYPKHKVEIYNNQNPLTPEEAFSGTERARTGEINECFLASIDEWGTYKDTDPSVIESEKNFLQLDNRYVVQGGETCNADRNARPYIGCTNALKELSRMHWSDLNFEYELDVLNTWKNQGCIEEIKRRLGYRFRLLESTIPKRVKPASTFSMQLKIANDGWASPYNPRSLEVILRNRQTGARYYFPVPEDLRMLMPGTTKVISITFGISMNMPAGEYQVLLNLPDPTYSLHNRPEYSIRLANQTVWEASTGYNSLLQNITVAP